MTTFQYNDGGRAAAGYKGKAGDCVVRAIAIATEQDYETVYRELKSRNEVFALASDSRSRVAKTLRNKKSRSPRDGNYKEIYRPYLESLGWEWVPTMQIGSGCRVHLTADELPKGRIICKTAKHLVAVIDGVINDTYNPNDRGITTWYGPNGLVSHVTGDKARCVYGYFQDAAQ